MMWREWREYRRIAAALALLSVVFYSALLPGHLTSQFAAQLLKTDHDQFAGVLCHGSSGDQSTPAAPTSSCPICKSLSAFVFGIVPTPQIVSPALVGRSLICEPASRAFIETRLSTPRNRGPPFPA